VVFILTEDGTSVPKLVGVDTYNELYFVICILLYIIEYTCWLIYWIQENVWYG